MFYIITAVDPARTLAVFTLTRVIKERVGRIGHKIRPVLPEGKLNEKDQLKKSTKKYSYKKII